DRRRKGTKALAAFDLQVEGHLHFRRTRVTEDRARAERARTELHSTLEPTHDPLRRKGPRSRLDHFVLAEYGELCPRRGQSPLDLRLREAGTEIPTGHSVPAVNLARSVPEEMVGCERASDSAAGIAGGWL